MKKVISMVALVVVAVVGMMVGCKKDKVVIPAQPVEVATNAIEIKAEVKVEAKSDAKTEVKAEVTDIKTTNIVDKVEVAPAK